MVHIEHYTFGKMIIGGKSHRKDLILLPDRIIDNWWRNEGHHLVSSDLEQVDFRNIDCLIIGTGKFGMMAVDAEIYSKLTPLNIEIVVKRTPQAVKEFNRMSKQNKVAAAFHLTC